jgi:hypothetical protein
VRRAARGGLRNWLLKKLSRALDEFGTYIDNNAGAIVNDGERRVHRICCFFTNRFAMS